jgi:hypothetical protein
MERKKIAASMPAAVKKRTQYNFTTEKYDISENGITYHLSHTQMNAMKNYMREFRSESVEAWYHNLNRFEKKDVLKTGGEIPPQEYNDGDFIE